MTIVKTLDNGITIYKEKNTQIGGYDYYSDAVGGGYCIVLSLVSADELEAVIEDLKKYEYEMREETRRRLEFPGY